MKVRAAVPCLFHVQQHVINVLDVAVSRHGWLLDEARLDEALHHGEQADGDPGDAHMLSRYGGPVDADGLVGELLVLAQLL